VGRYVLRRLAQLLPVFLGTTFLIYAMVWALPGDPFRARCGDRPCPDTYVAMMREQYHLDDPTIIGWAKYLLGLLHGDLGKTFAGQPVAQLLAGAAPVTIRLAILTVVMETAIGVYAGVHTAVRGSRFLDNLVMISTLMLLAVPVVVLGFVIQGILAGELHLISPNVPSDADWRHLLMPAFVLATGSLAYIARLTRAGVLEDQRSDYVRAARAKGLTEGRVVWIHMLRNRCIPVITFLASDLGALLGGAVIVEGIFNIKGVGGVLFAAIVKHEALTVTAVTTALVIAYLLINLVVDLLHALLDPRIRYS
jgi:oligopeptide transport system permease protein